MTLRSMTGYARVAAKAGDLAWVVEMKSVNGRGLELRCRLPAMMDALEGGLRDIIAKQLARGNVTLTVNLESGERINNIIVNQAVLDRYCALAGHLTHERGAALASAAELLALHGVVEIVPSHLDDQARTAIEAVLLESVAECCRILNDFRAREGGQLKAVLSEMLVKAEAYVDEANHLAPAQTAALHARLKERIAELVADTKIEPERLAQEVALLATRADIREELDRLRSHLQAGKELLAKTEPVGRALEFLSQELVREVNTLCSKATDMALTRIGLDLKSLIEQFREQIRNIE